MTPRSIFIVILGVSLFNGFFSPARWVLTREAYVWLAVFTEPSLALSAYIGSLIVALATLFFAGVPAGLFERMTGRNLSDLTSMLIWLGVAAVLTLPGLQQVLAFAGR